MADRNQVLDQCPGEATTPLTWEADRVRELGAPLLAAVLAQRARGRDRIADDLPEVP